MGELKWQRSLWRATCQQVVGALDWNTLRVERSSFLDPELTQHPADVLYAVDLGGGGPVYVRVLFEHKSYVETRINLVEVN